MSGFAMCIPLIGLIISHFKEWRAAEFLTFVESEKNDLNEKYQPIIEPLNKMINMDEINKYTKEVVEPFAKVQLKQTEALEKIGQLAKIDRAAALLLKNQYLETQFQA